MVSKAGKRAVTWVLIGSSLVPFLLSGDEKVDLSLLAAREQRRRAEILGEASKYRNEDLNRLHKARVGTAKYSSTQAKRPLLAASPPVSFSETSREAWLTASEQARNRLQFVVNRSHVLQLRLNHLRNLYFNESEESRREMLRAELAGTAAALEEAKREEESARAEWNDLLKEAKRVGVTAAEVGRVQQGIDHSSRIDGFLVPKDQD